MLHWHREHGDETVAVVSHFLSTPYPMVRRTPVSILLRYQAEAIKLARITARRI